MAKRASLRCPRAYAGNGTPAARLLDLVGPEAFATLQKAFGGRRIWIPKPGANLACGLCLRRDQCIHAWRAAGHSPSAIAKRLSISPKSVYRVLGKGGK